MDLSIFGSVLKTRTGDRIGKRPRVDTSVISDSDNNNFNECGNNIGSGKSGINNDCESLRQTNEKDSTKKESKISILRNTTCEDERPSQLASSSSEASKKKNKYTGWTVPSHNYQIPAITLGLDKGGEHNMTAQRFYKEYINQRRPVVIRNVNSSNENNGSILQEFEGLHEKWRPNNNHLKLRAENECVTVEVRPNEKERFGKGHETHMSFGRFCNIQERGGTMHYLTTQDVEANNDGRPELMAPFMKALRHAEDVGDNGYQNKNSGEFPLRPKLMGNLVPQNINLWMGNTSQQHGASSGLHHDYHDNFYIMIRGRKRFRLYSPKDTDKMYTRGKLHMVHPNGRINYEGDVTTAYGADIGAHAAAKASEAKDNAEKNLAEAEQGVLLGRAGAQEELERAEEMLDDAMEALIDAEMSGEDEGSFEDDDDGNSDGCSINKNSESCDSDGGAESNLNYNHDNNSNPGDPVLSEEVEEVGGSFNITKGNCQRLVDKTVKNPDNFSKIESDLLDDKVQLALQFPEILNAKSAFCDVYEGDILYLPASWFHEVTSFGNTAEEDNINEGYGNNHNNGHLALNYWFHPPDSLNNFKHPYSTSFWPNDYKMRFATKKEITP